MNEVPVSITALLPVNPKGLLPTTTSSTGISQSNSSKTVFVKDRAPVYLVVSGLPKLISPFVALSFSLCRLTPKILEGSSFASATACKKVGAPISFDFGLPRPSIPSNG